jgi:peptidylprolyl isomerase
MNKFIPFTALLISAFSLSLFAESTPEEEKVETSQTPTAINLQKVSNAFGHIIGQNIESLGLNFDMKEVLKGVQDYLEGKEAPMSDAECIQAITQIQEIAFQKEADENLKKAEEFLEKNKTNLGLIETTPGKVQYMVIEKGSGTEVKENFSPIIRYTGKCLDGRVFSESKEDEILNLEDTIEGFKQTVVGMKEGEKRKIFIHPDYGYGMTGYLPPSSLLTFEVEVVKANSEKTDDSIITKHAALIDHSQEIADVGITETNIR